MSDRCDCMTKVNEALAVRNTQLSTSFILTRDNTGMDCTPLMATEKRDPKIRGRATPVIPTFCPFCGTRYPRDGEEASGLQDYLTGDAADSADHCPETSSLP